MKTFEIRNRNNQWQAFVGFCTTPALVADTRQELEEWVSTVACHYASRVVVYDETGNVAAEHTFSPRPDARLAAGRRP